MNLRFPTAALSSLVLGLVGCATPDAGDPGASTAGGEAQVVPMDTWMTVLENEGPGLSVGSGMRFRADGVDVASAAQGMAMPGTCVREDDSLRCTIEGGEVTATPGARGRFVVVQGPLRFVVRASAPDDAASFDQRLGATNAQRDACRAAAECCLASEAQLYSNCDLDAQLGDRSAASCAAAVEAIRARFGAAGVEPPPACR